MNLGKKTAIFGGAVTAAHNQAWSTITSTPTTLSGYGITDAQGLDADLTALAGLSANGLIARTGSGTAAASTITGTANQVIVTNGDGVAGNPTLSLPQSIATGSTPTFAGLIASGNVGIGTTSPTATLEVVSSTTFPDIKVNGYGYTPGHTQQFSRGTPASPEIVQNGDRLMGLFGRAYRGDTFASDAFFGAFVDGVPVANTYVPTRFTWETRNAAGRAERMRLDKDGNVGIGTTSPSAKLHSVAGGGFLPTTGGVLSGSAFLADGLFGGGYILRDGSAYYGIWSESGRLRFGNGTADGLIGRMTVDSSGNVGIGTTSPTHRLEVVGPAANGSGNEGLWVDNNGVQFAVRRDAAGGGALQVGTPNGHNLYIMTNGATRISVTDTGGVRFNMYGAGTLVTDSSGNVTATSDARMKDISGSFGRGLDAIVNLSPKVYHWNKESGLNTDDVNVGLIAQEVLPYIPEAVGLKDDKYTMSDRPIIAALINAVKELKSDNDVLRARLEALEA